MTDTLFRPPPEWQQRAGRTLPFPPGNGEDEWEVLMDREPGEAEWERYHVCLTTGEVYRRQEDRYYQPTWGELPLIVRRRIWSVASRLR